MSELSWVVEHAAGRAVMVVTGAMTASTSTEFEAVLTALADATDVVIDLRGLVFVDSSGLSVFVAAYQRGLRHGTTVVLDPVPPFLARVLRVTGLHTILLGDGS